MDETEQSLHQTAVLQCRLDLARKAFREFYAQCFWSYREDAEITEDKIEFVIRGLREHGGLAGHRIAAELCPQAPSSLPQLKEQWLETSSASLELIARLPPDEVGCLYLDRVGKPVCPDPTTTEFPRLTRHFGSVKGAWPRILEE